MKAAFFVTGVALVSAPAFAGLVDVQTDANPASSTWNPNGVLDAGEYATFTGGGSGFGGPLGSGTLGFDTDGTNLYIGFDPGADLNDNVVLFLDTRPGGITDDTTLDDQADPGRNLSSNLTRDVVDNYAIGADFSVVIGGFGIVVFELVDDGSGQLVFNAFDGTFTGNDPTLAREISLPLASIGSPTSAVDFFAAYGSDTNFLSDEGVPAQPFSGGGNLGFDNNGNGPVTWENYNQFRLPTPGALALCGIAGLAGLRRNRA